MRTNFQRNAIRLVAIALLAASWCCPAAAQYMDPGFASVAPPGYGPPNQSMGAALPGGALDGPVWLRYTPTTDGLGYEGGYTTLGALIPHWNVAGDAIWFVEGQGHLSSEGRFFGNLGVGRRIYESGIRRTFGFSGWFDYDGDRYENFGHDFQQGGVTFDSFGDIVDFHINGYFPMREDFLQGPSSPGFFQNNILLRQGIDSALRGTDFEAGVRLPWAPIVDPRAYIGGYYYGSSAIEPFLGLSARMEIHPTEYTSAQVRVTEDERFGTSVMFGFELHLGGRRHRPAYDRITEPVHRNDHIVRFHQDPLFAINPNTGLRYRVVHVDAGAPATGLGTFELPFTTLAQAQAGSIPHDIIFVNGDQTYTGGIVLKDFQRLIGSGFPLVLRNGVLTVVTAPNIQETISVDIDGIPRLVRRTLNNSNTNNFFGDPRFTTGTGLPVGTLVSSGSDVVDTSGVSRGLSGFRVINTDDIFATGDILIAGAGNPPPTLTNPVGAAVTLANFNEVSNLRIENSAVGILGNGVTGFNLHDNVISGGPTPGEGIVLENISGAGLVRNNEIKNHNRPNPPIVPNEPFKDGLRLTVSGAASADIDVIGNLINDNDNGIRIISTTSGLARFDLIDNITNSNVNDGMKVLQAGPGVFSMSVVSSGIILDSLTGRTPEVPGAAANQTQTLIVQSAQSSFNGDITKITDTNGNGRGYFADVLDGTFNLLIDQLNFFNNDSSFFPRYGAIQLNVEPAVELANVQLSNLIIRGTGLHGLSPTVPTPTPDGFLDAGSGIRIVTNPGLGAVHNFAILESDISFNFSDGVKFLMLTEGLRTAAIPEGTARLLVRGNTISGNVGITDDNGDLTTFPFLNTLDDFDSPGNVAPFPVGLASNPHYKNEFNNNINGSGIVVRAKGTDTSRFFLDILDNTINFNEFDAINLAFAGRGNIDFVPSPTPPPPGVIPPVPLTPFRVFDPVAVNPLTNTPVASNLSPDTFGVSATVIIDNNQINVAYEDALKVVLLDGSKVQMRISNNILTAGDARVTPGNIPLPPDIASLLFPGPTVLPFQATTLIPLNAVGAPAVDPRYDSAIEIDTWDTSRLALVIDNNDITALRTLTGNGPYWGDGGITIQSHENTAVLTRITRNRVNEVLDGNTDFSRIFTTAPAPLTGAAINLLAEGNSTMVAFVNNNDLENRNMNTGVLSEGYFEATSADNATFCLQLLDNNAEPGVSPQLSHTVLLAGVNSTTGPIGDGFFLVQTELSSFEIEPTRASNHEKTLPESLSITTAVLAFGGAGPVLPISTLVQFGNVPSGTCEIRARDLVALGFPFDVGFPGLLNFDPPVIHP